MLSGRMFWKQENLECVLIESQSEGGFCRWGSSLGLS